MPSFVERKSIDKCDFRPDVYVWSQQQKGGDPMSNDLAMLIATEMYGLGSFGNIGVSASAA